MEFKESYNLIRPRYPELAGQVALITGSTRGIGKGIATRLAREGMRVILTGRQQSDIDPLLEDFASVGAEAKGFAADLAQPGEADRLFEQVMDAFGQVNLLVNNAADLRRKYFLEVDEAFFDYQYNVNFKSPFLLARRAAEHMKATGSGGNIVFVSSVGGLRAHFRGLPYDAMKGGMDSMVQAMAIEAAADHIRVNAIAPGATWIERRGDLDENDPRIQAVINRIPLKRFGLPLEMGAAVAFLASPDSAYITGQVLYIDGGITAQLSPRGQDI